MVREMRTICGTILAAAMSCAASAAVEPFGVDMYVKSADFGHYIFRGTRTVRPDYYEAGWSIGLVRDGAVCFTIADGSNLSYLRWPSSDTSWREGEWNHVAGSFKNGKLTLWVNGEKMEKSKRVKSRHFLYGYKMTNVCCVTSIDSPRPVVTNGYDAMSGVRFTGKVADWRFLNRALDDAEVSARAAKVAEMRASDPDAPKMVPDELGIDVEPPCALPNTPLTIQPSPQKAELSDANAVLEEPFVIVVPTEDGFAKTAGELFHEVMVQGLAMTASVVRAGTEVPSNGTRFTFVADEALGKEAYRINGAVVQGCCRVKIYGSNRGFFYAADTMRQLARIRSIENGRRLSLPERFFIVDRPLMPHRLILNDWKLVTSSNALADIKLFALSRINGIKLPAIGRADVTLERLRDECNLAGLYGVDVVSGFNYKCIDPPWTFSKPETMKDYKAQIDKLGQAGVKGLMFDFDDIDGTNGRLAWSKDENLRKRFRSEGAFHNALVHQGFEWADAYPNLASSFKVACPVFYFTGHREKRKSYLADFTKGFSARDVLMEHCAVLSDDVAALKDDGAETYCYYVNGIWDTPLFFTWYTGLESFRWSWYTWHVDLNGKGPVVDAEAMESVRSLHKRTSLMFCGSCSKAARIQTGVISWNPPAYDPDLCDRATAQALLGTGAYEQMRVIESALMPIVGFFGAFRTQYSLEWSLQTNPRRIGHSRKELAGYRRNYEAAEQAYAALEKAFANQKTVFDRPYLIDARKRILGRLRETLDTVRRRLDAKGI